MFEIKNVSKRFGEEYALREITMTIGGGMNFILGSSGSGKTTLLKILSGLEPDFEGEVLFCGKSLRAMPPKEKSELWGSVFGFVWQDFNLLDDRTVLENVLLPNYIRQGKTEKAAQSILRELKISELAAQKVGRLSGGQKQRVAIARELMKDPQVIFADEPTSALDAQAAKTMMEVLRTLSKKRTVILVTHDTSLVTARDFVYELDKGELLTAPTAEQPPARRAPAVRLPGPDRLRPGGAYTLGLTALKRSAGRTAVTVFAMLTAAALLLVAVSGAISDGSSAAFRELLATYGESLLDITVTQSFTGAGSTDGQQEDGPAVDVTQEIDGVYETYRQDPRVSYLLFAQAFQNIQITMDGKTYTVGDSGTMPVANGVLEGTVPLGEKNEVAVPESLAKQMGLTNRQAIGKELTFSAAVYEWEGGQPYLKEVGITATIVGVMDTTMTTEYGGKLYQTSIDDSFFFSPNALKELLTGAGLPQEPGSFYIRTKTPEDLIAIKDELNAQGIVPLGRFELVEDMVRMEQQSAQLSGTAAVVIGGLAFLLVGAAALLNAVLRRREYAIFKVSGYTGAHLLFVTFAEFSLLAAGALAAFYLSAPLLNLATAALWDVNILEGKLLLAGGLLTVFMALLSFAATALTAVSTNAATALRTGDR